MCKMGVEAKLKTRLCAADCFKLNNGGGKRGFLKNYNKKNRIDKHDNIEDDTNIQIKMERHQRSKVNKVLPSCHFPVAPTP